MNCCLELLQLGPVVDTRRGSRRWGVTPAALQAPQGTKAPVYGEHFSAGPVDMFSEFQPHLWLQEVSTGSVLISTYLIWSKKLLLCHVTRRQVDIGWCVLLSRWEAWVCVKLNLSTWFTSPHLKHLANGLCCLPDMTTLSLCVLQTLDAILRFWEKVSKKISYENQ